MISNTNHDSQWGRSEVVIIYPDKWGISTCHVGLPKDTPFQCQMPHIMDWLKGFFQKTYFLQEERGFEQNSLPEVYQGLHRFFHNPEILVVIISTTVMAL